MRDEVLLHLLIRLREEEGTEPRACDAHAAQFERLLEDSRILWILAADFAAREACERHFTDALLKGILLAEIRHVVIGPRNRGNAQTNLCHVSDLHILS